MIAATEWRHCDGCSEEWPVECFKASGNAWRGKSKALCDACFIETFPATTKECVCCGKRMKTRGKCPPKCRPCRKARNAAEVEAALHCSDCGKRCEGERMLGPRCVTCYHRDWRVRHGVNGKQTIGAWTQEPRTAPPEKQSRAA